MDRIGKFLLRRVLGKGASGTVYLALDTFLGKDVALKVLDRNVVKSSDFDRTNAVQFMNEASLAGKLTHPHIASILEASVSNDSGYIAIEYVPGGDLSQYTAPGCLLSPENAIQIAFKCCGALDYERGQSCSTKSTTLQARTEGNFTTIDGLPPRSGNGVVACLSLSRSSVPLE